MYLPAVTNSIKSDKRKRSNSEKPVQDVSLLVISISLEAAQSNINSNLKSKSHLQQIYLLKYA